MRRPRAQPVSTAERRLRPSRTSSRTRSKNTMNESAVIPIDTIRPVTPASVSRKPWAQPQSRRRSRRSACEAMASDATVTRPSSAVLQQRVEHDEQQADQAGDQAFCSCSRPRVGLIEFSVWTLNEIGSAPYFSWLASSRRDRLGEVAAGDRRLAADDRRLRRRCGDDQAVQHDGELVLRCRQVDQPLGDLAELVGARAVEVERDLPGRSAGRRSSWSAGCAVAPLMSVPETSTGPRMYFVVAVGRAGHVAACSGRRCWSGTCSGRCRSRRRTAPGSPA